MLKANRQIRRLGFEELETVHKLAHAIWPSAFKGILSPQQIEYMLEMMYSETALKKQLASGHLFYILTQEEAPVGYLSLEHTTETKRTKIHKIYLLPEQQGTGAGKQLIMFAESEAKKMQSKILYLNVNRYNQAIGFYEHFGLEKTSQENIDIGNGYLMEDWVMEKQISAL